MLFTAQPGYAVKKRALGEPMSVEIEARKGRVDRSGDAWCETERATHLSRYKL